MSALVSRTRYGNDVAPESIVDRVDRLLFDCTELVQNLGRCKTVTGIDRVQICLLDYVLNFTDDWEKNDCHLVVRASGGRIDLIDGRAARKLLTAASKPHLDMAELSSCAIDCLSSLQDAQTKQGDLYFIAGSFWTASTFERHLDILKEKGVVLGAYIYDLIPMTFPQFCTTEHCRAFNAAFAEVMPQLDFALSISDFVAEEVETMMAAFEMPAIPIIAAPLAHELKAPIDRTVEASGDITNRVGSQRFVLCVGTIEIRKNHLYLVNIWQALAREGIDMPTLVFVGQLGWRVNTLIEQLESLRFLNDKVKILSEVSDGDLAYLYENCLFTIFPSFVEGWGLPVGESLARGKIVVASSSASIPEVGGPHALYIDPHNLHTGISVVRKLLTDVNFYRVTEEAIRCSFKPRSWAAAGENFFISIAKGFESKGPSRRFAPALPSGQSLLLSDLVSSTLDIELYMKMPLRLILHAGWRPIDHGGSWILGKAAVVKFDTKCRPGTTINVVMTFVTVPWLRDSALVIQGESGSLVLDQRHRNRRVLPPSCMFRHSVKVGVGADGLATMHFTIEGEPCNNPPDEMAVLWIRMLTIGWCPSEDVAGRLALLEEAIWS